MKKKEETPKTPKPTKVWYIVGSSTDIAEISVECGLPTLKEAYEDEIMNNGASEKLYAFKIELLGEVKNELKIVK